MQIERWHKGVGLALGVISLIGALYAAAGMFFVTNDVWAAEQKVSEEHRQAAIRKWIKEADKIIGRYRDEIILLRHRTDLNDLAKDELIAVRDRGIAEEQRKIRCWESGQMSC